MIWMQIYFFVAFIAIQYSIVPKFEKLFMEQEDKKPFNIDKAYKEEVKEGNLKKFKKKLYKIDGENAGN